MLQRPVPPWIAVPALSVLAIFIAGFFHDTAASSADARLQNRTGRLLAPVPSMTTAFAAREAACDRKALDCAESMGGQRLDAFPVPTNLYRRSGEVACKVESVVKTYEDIDQRLKDFGGEITEMEITGNDDGRHGTLRCTVSTDKFNASISYFRGIGKVLSERITASSRPKSRAHVPPGQQDEDPDPRELSLVTVSILDERAAREVTESGGMLATAFNRSASHGLAGLAVIVEGLGWIAPYVFVLALAAAPFVVARSLRRRAVPAALPLSA